MGLKPVRQEGVIRRIQGMVDDYWKGVEGIVHS